ncbi:hypothetical protein M9Y10_024498 [Tritrichomonas musculus]|uniref:Right handed beta helix domain-containing protein n=1 Tax=Tritrichomonas musculus TaxID=1915356 RepID=A0ABR2HC51_9EUKA
MLFLLSLILFRINYPENRQRQSNIKANDYDICRDFNDKDFSEMKYNKFLYKCTNSKNQHITFKDTRFMNIYPASTNSKYMIIGTNLNFGIIKCLFAKCGFSSAMIYHKGAHCNLSMRSNSILESYNPFLTVSSSNILYSDSNYANIQDNKVNFIDKTHACRAFYFERSANTIFKKNTIKNANVGTFSGSGLLFNSAGSGMPLQISDCSFIGCSGSKGSTFSMSQLNYSFSILRTSFENCKNDKKLGNFFMITYQDDFLESTVSFNECKFSFFESNSIENGALGLTIEGEKLALTLIFEKTIFEHFYYSGDSLSAISFRGLVHLEISECTFNNISSLGGDSISLSSDSKTIIEKCKFIDCCSSGYAISSASANELFIFDSIVRFNRNDKCRKCGGISVQNSGKTEIENVQFVNTHTNPALSIMQRSDLTCELIVSDCVFDSFSGSKCFDTQSRTTTLVFQNNIMKNIVLDSRSNCCLGYINAKINVLDLVNVTFIDNKLNSNNVFGLLFNGVSTLSFMKCKFINNEAQEKPSLNGETAQFNSMNIEFIDCSFKHNKAFRNGGAVSIETQKSIEFKGCLFDHNVASSRGKGGAIFINRHSPLNNEIAQIAIEECNFTSNKAYDGYAIYIKGDDKNTEITIKDNLFIDNYDKELSSSMKSVIKSDIFIDDKVLNENKFIYTETEVSINPLLYTKKNQAELLDSSFSRIHALSNGEFSGELPVIYVNDSTTSNKISNSRFIDCKIPEGEDYLFVVQKQYSFENVEFSFENSQIGAIKIISSESITIRNCAFYKCSSKGQMSTAITIIGNRQSKNVKEVQPEVFIEDLNLTECGQNGFAFNILNYPHVTIRNINVSFEEQSNSGNGLLIRNCGICTLTDCFFDKTKSTGINYVLNKEPAAEDMLVIKDSIFDKCVGSGCYLDIQKGYSIGITIENNEFNECIKDDNHESIAIGINPSANSIPLTIRDNTFNNCGKPQDNNFVLKVSLDEAPDGLDAILIENNVITFDDIGTACNGIKISQANRAITIRNCSFTRCYKTTKETPWENSLSLNRFKEAEIDGCQFFDCGAVSTGSGGGNVIGIESEVSHCIIRGCLIEFSSSDKGSSGISSFMDNILIENNSFIKCYENTIRIQCRKEGSNKFELINNHFSGSREGPILFFKDGNGGNTYLTQSPTIKDNTFDDIEVLQGNEQAFVIGISKAIDEIEFYNNTFNNLHTHLTNFGFNIYEEEGRTSETALHIKYTECKFTNNHQESRTTNKIENIKITYNGCTFENNEASETFGSLHINTHQNIKIENSEFKNNSAIDKSSETPTIIPGQGGSIFIERGEVTISGSTFSENYCSEGMAIYIKNNEGRLTINDNSKFINNLNFKQIKDKQYAIKSRSQNIDISDTEFIIKFDSQTQETYEYQCGFIHLLNFGNIMIKDSNFSNSHFRSSIFYDMTETSTSKDNSFRIEGCKFDECLTNVINIVTPTVSLETIRMTSCIFNKCTNRDSKESTTIEISKDCKSITLIIEDNTFNNCGKPQDNNFVLKVSLDEAPDGLDAILIENNVITFDDIDTACNGIKISQANRAITIRNCSFTRCYKTTKETPWENSLSLNRFKEAEIDGCQFFDCGAVSTGSGGGNVIGIESEVSHCIIRGCLIEFSSSDKGGSGISSFMDNILIENNSFIKCYENTIRIQCRKEGSNKFELINNHFSGSREGPILFFKDGNGGNTYLTQQPAIKDNTFDDIEVLQSDEQAFVIGISKAINEIEFYNNTFNNLHTHLTNFGFDIYEEEGRTPETALHIKYTECKFTNNHQESRTTNKIENIKITYNGCTFENNEASETFGSLYINTHQNIKIENSEFKTNSAIDKSSGTSGINPGQGGSIFIERGEVTISGSTFSENYCSEGMAIYIKNNEGRLTINDNSKFINNLNFKQIKDKQYAIKSRSQNIDISDTEFIIKFDSQTQETYEYQCGFIHLLNFGNIMIKDSNFSNSHFRSSIFYDMTETSTSKDNSFRIEGCKFDECLTNVINIVTPTVSLETIRMTSCIFNKCTNRDSKESTTIEISKDCKSITLIIEDNTFNNCGKPQDNNFVLKVSLDEAPDGLDAILIENNVITFDDIDTACNGIKISQANRAITIRNCSFTRCYKTTKETPWENSLSLNRFKEAEIDGCQFFDCGAVSTGSGGGNVIGIESEVSHCIIRGCLIEFSSSDKGGSGISSFMDNILIENNSFIKCYENTIRIQCRKEGSNQFELINNHFSGSREGPILFFKDGNGGNTYLTQSPTIKDNTFDDIEVLQGDEQAFVIGISKTINEIEFYNNTFNNLHTHLTNFGFDIYEEEGRTSGTALHIKYTECKFTNNHQESRTTNKIENIKITYNGCTFENNEASETFGSLYINTHQNIKIENSEFKTNSAIDKSSGTSGINPGQGGSIFIERGEVTISGSTFSENYCSEGMAIYIKNNEGRLTINGNSKFINNLNFKQIKDKQYAIKSRSQNIDISDTEFIIKFDSQTQETYEYQCGFIHLLNFGNIMIKDSNFSNSHFRSSIFYDMAETSPSKDNSFRIEGCKFDECLTNVINIVTPTVSLETIRMTSCIFNKCTNRDSKESTTIEISKDCKSITLIIEDNTFNNCGKPQDNNFVLKVSLDEAPDGLDAILIENNVITFDDIDTACNGIKISQANRAITIRNCSFTRCYKTTKETPWENSLSLNRFKEAEIDGCQFFDCGAVSTGSGGGNVIGIESEVSHCIIRGCLIEFSSSDKGGSGISSFMDNILIENNSFIKCYENTIRIQCRKEGSNKFELINNHFSGSREGPILFFKDGNGGNTYLTQQPAIKDNTFDDIEVLQGDEQAFVIGISKTINEIEFYNNTFNNLHTHLTNFGFDIYEEEGRTSGTALHIKYTECKFTNNHQESRTTNKIENIKITYNGCTFENNEASETFGSLYINTHQNIKIENSEFKTNSAIDKSSGTSGINPGQGGSIFIERGKVTISGSTFSENYCSEGMAIYIKNNEGRLTINDNSKFINNLNFKQIKDKQYAIESRSQNIDISDTEFIIKFDSQTQETYEYQCGFIHLLNFGNIMIKDSNFSNSHFRSSIFYDMTETSPSKDNSFRIEGCKFDECLTNVINIVTPTESLETIRMTSCIFNKCTNRDSKESTTIEISKDCKSITLIIEDNTFNNCGKPQDNNFVLKVSLDEAPDGLDAILIENNVITFDDIGTACNGIKISQANRAITIRNCSFTRCYKTTKETPWENSLSLNRFKEAEIDGCQFFDCGAVSTGSGGGNVIGIESEVSHCIIRGCLIEFSSSDIGGSGISSFMDNILIENNSFIKCYENTIRIQCRKEGSNQFELINNHFSGSREGPILFFKDGNGGNTYLTQQPAIKDNTFDDIEVLQGNEQAFVIGISKAIDEIEFYNNTFNNLHTHLTNFGFDIYEEEGRTSGTALHIKYTECKFTNNHQESRTTNKIENIKITYNGCTFEGNQCKDNGGSLYINNNYETIIEGSQFISNSAAQNGGAVYVESSQKTAITNCDFTNCLPNAADSPYSIQIKSGPVDFDTCVISFDGNAKACGGIDFGDQSFNLLNCKFVRTHSSGSILFAQSATSTTASTIKINNCTFEECTGDNTRCFSLTLKSDSSLTFEDVVIQKMKESGPNGYFGLLSFDNKDKLEIKNLTLTENQCNSLYGGGSGLLFSGINEITFTECNFISNTAKQTLDGERPTPSSGEKYYNGDGGGFQIGYSPLYYNVDLIFDTCTFKGNKAFRHGGGLALQTAKTVTIKYCTFEENVANDQESSSKLLFDTYYHLKKEGRGGAIYINPTFTSNSQNDQQKEDKMAKVDINNCKFISNSAFDGFAIYIEGDGPDVQFSFQSNEFKDNHKNGKSEDDSYGVYRAVITSEVSNLQDVSENSFSNTDGSTVKELQYVDHSGNPIIELPSSSEEEIIQTSSDNAGGNEEPSSDGKEETVSSDNVELSSSAEEVIESESESLPIVPPTGNCEENQRCDLDNQTVTSFNVTSSSFINLTHPDNGAAIHFINCAITCKETYFYNCSSTKGGGGGIYIYYRNVVENQILVDSCEFYKCRSYFGGAIYAFSNVEENNIIISNNKFQENEVIPQTSKDKEFGGSAIYMAAKQGKVLQCIFLKNKGKGGALKIIDDFTSISSKLIQLEELELKSPVTISDCHFEIDSSSSCSISYVRGVNMAVSIDINNCQFTGLLSNEAHHIDAISLLKKQEKPKLHINLCTFSSEKKSILNSNDSNLVAFNTNIRDITAKKEERINDVKLSTFNLLIVSLFAVAALVAIIIIRKSRKLVDNENDLVDVNEIISQNIESLI